VVHLERYSGLLLTAIILDLSIGRAEAPSVRPLET
jgi:hypothetical protein